MFFVLLIALFIAIFLEGTVLSLPLAFILLLCYSVLKRTEKVFLSAFGAGILLDLVNVRFLGATSVFFLLFFAVILLYQRKYEIRSYPFVIVSTFAGAYIYLSIFGKENPLLLSLISCVIAVVIFAIGRKLKKEK